MAIEIKIGASFNDRDIKRAQRELANLARAADKMSESITAKMARTGKSFESMGQTLSTKVSLPLVALGTLSVKAFTEQEDAIAKMEAVLKSTGGVAGITSKHITDLAGSLQETTTFADEVTVNGAALLLTFKNIRNEMGDGNDVFDRTIKASQDLSALMGTDLNSSVMMLGKALQDPEKGLSKLTRAGIQFSEQQKDQIKTLAESGDMLGAQKIMLGEIESQFGGTAEAMAQTAAGRLKQAFNQLGEAAEAIGAELAPAIEKVAGLLSWIGRTFAGLPGPIKTVVTLLGGIAAAIGPAVWLTGNLLTNLSTIGKTKIGTAVLSGLASFRDVIANAVLQSTLLWNTMSGVSTAMSGLAIVARAGGVLAVGLGAVAFVVRQITDAAADRKLGDFAKDVKRVEAALLTFGQTGVATSTVSLDQFKSAIGDVRTELTSAFVADYYGGVRGGLERLRNQFNGVFSNADKGRERLKTFDDALMSMSFSQARDLLDQYATAAYGAEANIYSFGDVLPQFSAKLQDNINITDPAARAVLGLGDGMEDLAEQTERATEALDAWERKIKAQFDPLWGFQDAVYEQEDALKNLQKAQLEHAQVLANFPADSEQARQAIRNLDQAERDLITTTGTMDAKYVDLINGIKAGDVSLDDAIGTIQGLAAQHGWSADQTQRQIDKFNELAAVVLAADFPDVSIPVNSNASEVLQTLIDLRNVLKDTEERIKATGGLDAFLLSPQVVGGNATGGPVQAGVAGWVGERGKELFIPSTDGVIVPHYASRAMAGAGPASDAGTNVTYNITVNGMVGRDKQDILAFLARELPKVAATQARSQG